MKIHRYMTPMERFMAKAVIDPDGCWLWSGGVDRDGYGRMWIDRNTSRAHRAAYVLFVGPIPTGMVVCHRCDTPRCVRPDHLFLGTHADNIKDRDAKGRTARGDRMVTDRYMASRPRGRRHHWNAKPWTRLTGDRNGMARVSATDVPVIRAARRNGDTLPSLAARYGVTPQAIHSIVTFKTWRHIKED